jgi:hypothetical protein
MPVRCRVAVAAVLTVAAVAVPVAAFASGPGSPATKPAHSPATLKTKSAAGASGSAAASQLSAALASSAGISPSRLDTGLAAAKRAGGGNAAGITAFALAAGVSRATAQRIVYTEFGTGGEGEQAGSSLTGPSAVAALVARLGVSTGAARHALQQIGALSGKNGVDPASPAFAAIAHDLGVSPARLSGALDGVKESAAGR